MKINIDIYKQNIWKKKDILTKTEIKKIITKCLEYQKQNTYTTAKQQATTKQQLENHNTQNKQQKPKQVFLNVSFVDKNTITQYNTKYRNKNTETNVLSFENQNKQLQTNTNILFLGEMILCYEKIKQEAELYNKPFKERLYHLFIHSLLHLLGYDHIDEKDRIEMEKIEENILSNFNIKNPYFYN